MDEFRNNFRLALLRGGLKAMPTAQGVRPEDELKPVDVKPDSDLLVLEHKFPDDWETRSPEEWRAFAASGLAEATSDQFKATTPDEVVAALTRGTGKQPQTPERN